MVIPFLFSAVFTRILTSQGLKKLCSIFFSSELPLKFRYQIGELIEKIR